MRARLIAALAVAAGLSGCADNDATVQIYGMCSYNESCAFGSSCDSYLLGDPWVDLAATNQLDVFVELRNQLASNADPSSGRTNSNDARVEAVEIAYEGQTVSVPESSIPVQTLIPAGGSSVALMYAIAPPSVGPAGGLSPAATVLRDAALAAGGPIRVVAWIRAKGHFVGGGYFETGPWKVPIQVCSGCFGTANYGYACEAGQVVTAVCPNAGQIGAATCGDAPAP